MTLVGFTAKGLDNAAHCGADITSTSSIYQLLWAASVNWPPCTCGGGAASHSPAACNQAHCQVMEQAAYISFKLCCGGNLAQAESCRDQPSNLLCTRTVLTGRSRDP